ncbi:MAG TPA: pyridoxal-phosphate dependent enzyme [Candidatus Methylomirabilis sp.]
MGWFRTVCQSCGRTYPTGYHPVCSCGGMVDIEYAVGRARIRQETNPLLRFFDLLPLKEESSVRWLGEGNTPTVHAKALGKTLGLDQLYLKDETRNPTRTTKDRMASVVLSYFQDLGVREFACSSTGNSSTSFAHGVKRFPGFKLHVFVGRDFLHRMNFDSSESVKVYWVKDATFAEAHECAKVFARQNSHVMGERGFFNPGRREGLKLAFLEGALDMPHSPHWYFQAVSSGMGVYGAWRGAQQLSQMGILKHLPRLACVQQSTCDPMVRSWKSGSPTVRPQDIVREPQGIAEAILRGDPTHTYPHLRGVVQESGGLFESVTEAQIREAQRMLLELEGIEACPSSATTVAAAKTLSQRGVVGRDEVVFVNLTGGQRSSEVTPREYTTFTKRELLEGVA